MTDQEVPGRAEDSGQRLAGREFESDFARLPATEVEAIPAPGGGPQGSVSGHVNVPLVVVFVGFLVVFTTFGFESVWPLAIGLLLMLVGGIWNAVRNRTLGRGSGRVVVR